MPRIESALKNYLSLKMAQSLAPPFESPAPEADSEMQPVAAPMDATGLQGCARALLKTLNALESLQSVSNNNDNDNNSRVAKNI